MKAIDWQRWSARATVLMALVALGLVGYFLSRLGWAQIMDSLGRIRPYQVAGAGAATVASYLTLTGFDRLGVHYAGARLPYPRVALAAFLALSIGHTVGLAPLSSGTIRYRYYREAGLDLTQIGLIVALSAATVTLGEASLAGLALLTQPTLGDRLLHLPAASARIIGWLCLAVPPLYLALAAGLRRPLRLRRRVFHMPSPAIAVQQIGLGLVNYGFVAAALYFVLPHAQAVDYRIVAMAYVLGNLAALVSHVPGGLGVLEAVIVALLPGVDAIGPLIVFRIVYFLVPLALGCLLLAWTEVRRRPKPELAP